MARFSFSGPTCNRGRAVTVLMAVVGVLACAASALAGGGKVLPPDASPMDYSLSDMAVETAAYNVGPRTGTPPDVPFEVLVGDSTVEPDTMLYLPVFFADNAPPPTTPPFPKNIRDRDADADYLYDLVGVEAFVVEVDGKTTILCDDYVVGVKTALLPDGGTRYIVSAAFLAPLTPGEHTVGIGGVIDGKPVVFVSYTVTVAGGGKVLPPDASPKGYSLSRMAEATAAFNVGPRTGTPPDVPFEILVGDTTVEPDTRLYLPVFFADNAPPATTPPFPKNIRDQDADADYLYDLAGVEAFVVDVDGKTTILCDDYVVGVKTALLPDGGTRYIVSAAFLTPLTPGEHTVGIGGVIDGEPEVFVSYSVTVR